jgi:hypothetical protein
MNENQLVCHIMDARSDKETEALRIIALAEKNGVPLKLIGGIAVKLHSGKWGEFLESVMQRHPADLDYITLSKYRVGAIELLQGLGYAPMRTIMPQADRIILVDRQDMHVDVFFDKLMMCHEIDFRDRLGIDSQTISLSDLLLSKLQIVKINEKDIKDVMILLREHAVGKREDETINGEYVSKLFANDWGFYYTATTNLKLVRERLNDGDYRSIFKEEDITDMRNKIDKLLDMIENEPKSMAWKIRARTGPRKKWYQDVEEVRVGGEFENELAKLLKGL